MACHEELRDIEPADSAPIPIVGKHHQPEHRLVHTLLYEAGTVIPDHISKILPSGGFPSVGYLGQLPSSGGKLEFRFVNEGFRV